MGVSRRALLVTGGASIVLLGTAGGWLGTRTSRSAREPWQTAADGLGDARLDALAYAILAPNPHNMQPWLVRLEGEDRFSLFVDRERMLPETDPPGRQITIGFGAFLELFRQAAAGKGLAAEVDPFPEGEPFPELDERPVARVRLVGRQDPAVPDPLFPFALTRHTRRQAFDTNRPVNSALIQRVLAAAHPQVRVDGSADREKVARLRKLTAEAWVAEWTHDQTRRETIAVTRIGKGEVSDKPWGITLDGPLLSSLGALGLLNRQAMDVAGEVSYDETLNTYIASCETAMAHIWSSTARNTRRDQLNAGAAWVRMHQAATREGLAFHPLSQPLQEFAAMEEYYRQAHALLAPDGHTVQMLVRLGYAGDVAPSPREPLQSKLLTI